MGRWIAGFALVVGALSVIGVAEVPVVLDHALCKEVGRSSPYPCRTPSTSFSGADGQVYAWVKLGTMSEGHALRWEWRGPDGALYHAAAGSIPSPGHGKYWSWYVVWTALDVRGTRAATMPGQWEVALLVDGTRILAMRFQMMPTFPAPTSVPPIESPVGSLASGTWPYTGGAPVVSALVRRDAAPPSSGWTRVSSLLVDTGGSHTLLPRAVADTIGLSLRTGEPITLKDLSGTEIKAWLHWVELALVTPTGQALRSFRVRAAFTDMHIERSILGRDILGQVEITFEGKAFTIKRSP